MEADPPRLNQDQLIPISDPVVSLVVRMGNPADSQVFGEDMPDGPFLAVYPFDWEQQRLIGKGVLALFDSFSAGRLGGHGE